MAAIFSKRRFSMKKKQLLLLILLILLTSNAAVWYFIFITPLKEKGTKSEVTSFHSSCMQYIKHYAYLQEYSFERVDFTTLGIYESYLDISDASFLSEDIPVECFLASGPYQAAITGVSCPAPGLIRIHFDRVLPYSSALTISYAILRTPQKSPEYVVDLAIFMGQSNMSGLGTASLAPIVSSDQALEFRAISDPARLYTLTEPFGVNENNPDGLDDHDLKTGSMVSAFASSYYDYSRTRLICVSASQGATEIKRWLPGKVFLKDAGERFQQAVLYLKNHGYQIRHTFVVWCQGETDGRLQTSHTLYQNSLISIADYMRDLGANDFFVVRIGNNRDDAFLYDTIIKAQTDLCLGDSRFTMISTSFSAMAKIHMMQDKFH
ncbi:MAG: sialate O-acetylesterase, partial [Lachnospiraceae bacterium]|nr:sialate O-acetylesterase [Lachnospiraceae bacterium]